MPDKGNGLVAITAISRGTRILSEPPLFKLPFRSQDTRRHRDDVLDVVDALIQEKQKQFYLLHNSYRRYGEIICDGSNNAKNHEHLRLVLTNIHLAPGRLKCRTADFMKTVSGPIKFLPHSAMPSLSHFKVTAPEAPNPLQNVIGWCSLTSQDAWVCAPQGIFKQHHIKLGIKAASN
jgi:hypothetical protein